MKRVLLVLPTGYEEFETFTIREIFGYCEKYSSKADKVVLKITGLRRDIRSAWGVKIKIDYSLSELNINDFYALIIPGGFEEAGYYKDLYSKKILKVIKDFHEKNKLIAAVCVGSLALGKCGILRERNATTYFSQIRRKQLKNFGAILSDESITIDENIITSNSPGTAIKVALILIEKLTNSKNKEKIKNEIGL